MSSSPDQFAAFKHLSYRRYFAGRFLAAMSFHILSVAVAWQIYDETRNPIYLGWIGLVQFLPALLLVIVTGLAADRMGRRFVMGSAICLMAVSATLILVLAATEHFNPIWVLGVLTLLGVARAFNTPASTSLAVNVVPREDFPNAIGWVTSSWQLASIVGPAAGGLLYGVGNLVAYGAALIGFLMGALFTFAIPKPHQKISKEPTSLSTLLGGFSYVWKQKIVLGAISLDLFAVLLGAAVALMPVYARDILELGPVGLGWLRAAPGVGAVAMIIYLTRFPIKDHAGVILLFTVALFGSATVVFGYSTLAWLSILALIFVGAFDMISVYIREIVIQIWTPDEVRGRVNAVNGIFIGASNEVGEARAGFMAAKWGAVFTVVIGGYAAIAVAALTGYLFPGLRKTRYLDKTDTL